jgi:hypothetical protein
LSPHAPARTSVTAPLRAERSPEVKSEVRSTPQPTSKQNGAAAPAARSAVLEAPRLGAVGERLVDQPQRNNMFDAVWPAEAQAELRTGASVAKEAFARAPKPAPANARERVEPMPALEKPAEAAPPVQRAASDPRPVSILKSGVIDGMAYTLYTDGSIEAQLAQGTMRFGSIDELREHLEGTL